MSEYIDDERDWAREELEEKLAEEKADLETAWREQVKSVLSSTRIDPQSKGKEFRWFTRYEGPVSPEQIEALKRSDYGRKFHRFVDIWKCLPEETRCDLLNASEVFAQIASITHAPYNELCHQEKDKEPFTQLEILKQARWLQTFFWSEGFWQFDSHDLGEQLNRYIDIGMEWPYLERLLLKRCIHRATKEQRQNIDTPFKEHPILYLLARAAGFFVPLLIGIGFYVAILIWSLKHLDGASASIWAIVGLALLGVMLPINIVHYGTSETRRLLKRIVDPGWDPYNPKIHRELNALDHTVNSFLRDEHINLRLVREQLTRLQGSEIHIPVQFLTLIDRSIAKGQLTW